MKIRILALLGSFALSACPEKGNDSDSDGGTTLGELPPPAEVCRAACAQFAACADDPATFDQADCVDSCEAGVEFMAMNNPGTECGEYELGRQDCLSKATCEQLDLYVTDSPDKPCQEWNDLLGQQCAIE